MKLELTGTSEQVCRRLGELFHSAGERLHLVGGAVRDRLLGRCAEADLDFTTSAAPEQVRRIVRPAAAHCYDKSGAKGYGTMGVILKNGPEVEITPYRICAAFAPRGQNSAVARGAETATLEQDLNGRDFTINALAVDVCPGAFGAVADPCGGMADLEARRLRTPLEPEKTFEDDPLRLLRAVRLATDFRLQIEPATLNAVTRMAVAVPCALERTAQERIREELLRMLALLEPSAPLRLLRSTGLLAVVLPEAQALAGMQPQEGSHHKDAFEHTLAMLDNVRSAGGGGDPILLMAALLHDMGKPAARRLEHGEYSFHEHEKTGAALAQKVCRRLRLSNAQTERVHRLVLLHHRLHAYTAEWTDAAVRRAVNELGAHLDSLLALARADITTSDPGRVQERRHALDHFVQRVQALDAESVRNPRPPIDGHEIINLLGLQKGGPEVGRAVKYLMDQIVTGDLDPNDADAARRMVRSREWEGP